MAEAPVRIPVKVTGLNDVQKLERKMEQLEKDLAKVARTGPKAANAIKKTGRAAATASGNVQRLGIAFRTTLAPIVAITGAFALLNKALNVTGQRAAEANVLSSSLKDLVDDGDAAADALLGIADRLGKTTLFDEEDFTAQFKLFTSFRNIGVDSYERVGEAAADIATKLGTGPKEAALQLAKALEDPAKQVTALSRSGTVFTDQQKAQIKALQQSGDLLAAQEIILSEIEKQYGGAAKAAGAAGFAGALDSAGEAWRDFLEALGESSESGAVDFLNIITDGLNFLTENFDVVAQTATAVRDVFVQPFVALAEGIGEVLPKVDNFEATFRGTLAIISKILTDITNNVLKPLFKVVGFVIGGIIRLLAGLASTIASIVPKIVRTVTGAIRIIATAIERFINATPLGLLSKLFGLDAGALATGGLQKLANGIDGLADSVASYGDQLRAAAAAANLPVPNQGGNANPFAGAGPRGALDGSASGSGNGAKNAQQAADKALKDREKLEEDTARQLVSAEKLAIAAQREQFLLEQTTEIQKIKAASLIKEFEIMDKYSELVAKSLSDEEKAALIKAQTLELTNEETRRVQQLNKLKEDAIRPIQEDIELIEARLAGREREYQIIKLTKELEAKGVTNASAQVNRLFALREEEEAVNNLKAQYEEMANAIAGPLTQAFGEIIKGAKTTEQALADAFQSIADSFIDMAMRMIQQWLVLKALNIISAGAGPGGFPNGSVGAGAFKIGRLAAEGGYVTGPTPALVGEGGEPEVIIPESKLDGAMRRWSAGQSGNQLLADGGEMVGSGGTAIADQPPQINISGGTTVINNEEFIRMDQLPSIIAQSAQAGEAKTLRRLRMSPGTRRQTGI